MKAVVQRVDSCIVSVSKQEISKIGRGLVCYLGIAKTDKDSDLDWMVKKVAGLRIFPDKSDRMNLSVLDLSLPVLVISQFTLFGDVRRGFRPSFSDAEEPQRAKILYEEFMRRLNLAGVKEVFGGVFAADMSILQLNSGPVTIELDSN
ncbi:D-tyrosyl-tRNA(Tyr) deacylase [bacterium]|nr:D-tyrosyl-tRNA(Tyr) deacylase [bacterium]